MSSSTTRRVVVAIDGPAGAGKSTIAKRLAARLGFTYIDTGAMYRAVGLWAIRQTIDLDDMLRMEELAKAAEIDLDTANATVRLNGEDVTHAIRQPAVSDAASKIAVIPGVRRAMVQKQREMAQRTSVVMEGRDIGTVVFPDADVKVFLDADLEERIRRRVAEMPPGVQSADEVAAKIRERDQRDRGRAEAPLTQAPDATYLDSTRMGIGDVEEAILKMVRDKVSNGKDFQ